MRDIKDLIAEVYGVVWTNDTQIKNLERLVELARADEREACAKLCEDLDAWNMDDPASTAAEAIRARGQ
jgi:hypothetical protein